ncbi:hypothetical protein K1719_009501 [Acacia pycnantha]|nr:hypothetical protein K1719_009501 [Acacia pycnantha]
MLHSIEEILDFTPHAHTLSINIGTLSLSWFLAMKAAAALTSELGGPQQYRWMYLFERSLRTLKNKIKNPRYVEGSIAEAFLVEDATKFASYYYPPEMISRWRGVPRNDDGGDTCNQNSIFNFPGRVVGKHWRSTLEGRDKQVVEWYILNNCEEAAQYLKSDRRILRCRILKLSKSRTLSFLNGFDPTSWKIHQIAMKLRGVYLMELQ